MDKKFASINVFLFQLPYSTIYGSATNCANAFHGNGLFAAEPALDQAKKKAILGVVFTSAPHLMFLFLMLEVMLREHYQQYPMRQLTAEEVAANLNETVSEEDGSVQDGLLQ